MNRSIARTLATLALLGPGMLACRGPTLPEDSTTPVVIGAVVPLSGGLAGDGAAYRDAFALAVREVNAAGGIHGRRIELRVADSETDMAVGLREAERLVDEGAVAVLGDASSASTLAIYEEVTGPAGIPQISCVSTSPLLTAANEALPESERYFFRTAPPDQFQAQVVLEAAVTEGMCARTAVLHQDDTYGDPFADAIEQAFSGSGSPLVARVGYVEGAIDFDAAIATLRAATPDCVVLVMYPIDAGNFLREWDAIAPTETVQWIGGDGLYSDALLTAAGGTRLIDGFLATAPATQAETPQYNAFANRLTSVTGNAPTIFQSNCYDAAAMLLLAIADATSLSGADIRDALLRISSEAATNRPNAGDLAQGLLWIAEGRTINYAGASGPVDFDVSGDVIADYVIGRFDATMMRFVEQRTLRPARIP